MPMFATGAKLWLDAANTRVLPSRAAGGEWRDDRTTAGLWHPSAALRETL
jgi:hypothetical protein